MLLARGSFDHSTTVCALLFLCFCVFMQVLGAPMTLWDFDLEFDPANAPFLEGYSLPTVVSHTQPSRTVAFIDYASESLRYCLHAHSLFRPPNSLI
jgi:hypothetical protein